MTIYSVKFYLVVEADDEDDAMNEAWSAIGDTNFQPHVEVEIDELDEDASRIVTGMLEEEK